MLGVFSAACELSWAAVLFSSSIEDLENEKVNVFPNPFVERITISDVEGMTGIRLLDVLGREV